MKLNKKMIEKAKAAKTVEELIALAKENGVELTDEEAGGYFAKLNPRSGELCDDELDNVSGGGCENKKPVEDENDYCDDWHCKWCLNRSVKEEPSGAFCDECGCVASCKTCLGC